MKQAARASAVSDAAGGICPGGGGFRFAGFGEAALLPAMDVAEKIFEEARRAGIDLNLIDLNLEMTPEERVRHHDSALQLMLALREARKHLGKPATIASAAL